MERSDRAGVAAFFSPDEPLSVGATVSLGDEVARHMRVRRVGIGERVAVLDGAGKRAEGAIVRLSRNAVAIELDVVAELEALPPVHLLVPIADRDRMLWLAEKVTELGASSWRPVLWKRSRSVKPRGEGPTFQARIRARMASALEQSGGGWLPALFPDATVERAIAAAPQGGRMLLDATGEPMLGLDARAPVTLAIGPEGGFEDEEREELAAGGFVAASLAGHILRFETAAVAALALARAALALKPETVNGR